MSMIDLLPIVPGLPLAGFIILLLMQGRLPGKAAAWLATAMVGLAFALAVGIGLEYRALAADMAAEHGQATEAEHGEEDAEHASEGEHDEAGASHADEKHAKPEAPVIVKTLWTWMSAGRDQVALTTALEDLPDLTPVEEGQVGQLWFDAELIEAMAPDQRAIMEQRLERMWDPDAVVGERPVGGDVPAGIPVTFDNVPPSGNTDQETAIVAPRYERAFNVDVALQLDALSLLMMLIVTGVGFLIHLYSIGYMGHDADIRRYFTYLNLFIFSMLTLVLGANFLVLFVGWELVGACSFLLIGFWHRDPSNASAGRKAFIVNRIGDFAFLLGLMLIWTRFGSLAFGDVLPEASAFGADWITLAIPALLLIGATGKSAQLPLYVWLPDAMAGPTPVSALIHAATMVTAGVYMVARAHPLFEAAPIVLTAVAVVGALTALLAACMALVQADIKRVLAYSTISQLGYMFLGVGSGAYVAGIFHLMTHAFFKALLFLGAGSLMHAMEHGFEHADEHPEPQDGVPAHQDMRQMGGLLKRAPITGWTFVIGGLALAGLPGLAGFWSKDEILFSAVGKGLGEGGSQIFLALYAIGTLTAFLTALYTGRQLFMALGGQPRSQGAEHAAESAPVMTIPLIVLALLSIVGGYLNAEALGLHALADFLAPVLGSHHPELSPIPYLILASIIALAGLALAWMAYGATPRLDPAATASRFSSAFGLFKGLFYVDELYDRLFVAPFKRSADFLWKVVDVRIIDAAVNGTGRSFMTLGQSLRRWQTGYVRNYALSMLLGAVAIAIYLVLRGGM